MPRQSTAELLCQGMEALRFKVNVVLFTFDALAGGIIALWKSVVITVKVEIGGAAAQIVLREVTDKRRLYSFCEDGVGTGVNDTMMSERL